ncbi:hypothetical protein M011DRAFT_313203 [Sporormia fimetaria CBS 119925]|uniref:Uncharacterized protein n=1 Tax=Sporormia fimetaria CBS 119925 TaxID=1340428 RepID=A0A6A6VK69_9PLEO|nr:hypothetical protein M011DRAFT_313203 [Sporormia fimetaria CBS 119925]
MSSVNLSNIQHIIFFLPGIPDCSPFNSRPAHLTRLRVHRYPYHNILTERTRHVERGLFSFGFNSVSGIAGDMFFGLVDWNDTPPWFFFDGGSGCEYDQIMDTCMCGVPDSILFCRRM